MVVSAGVSLIWGCSGVLALPEAETTFAVAEMQTSSGVPTVAAAAAGAAAVAGAGAAVGAGSRGPSRAASRGAAAAEAGARAAAAAGSGAAAVIGVKAVALVLSSLKMSAAMAAMGSHELLNGSVALPWRASWA